MINDFRANGQDSIEVGLNVDLSSSTKKCYTAFTELCILVFG